MARLEPLVAVVVAIAASVSARADGLIYKLAKDGDSATFEMEYKANVSSKKEDGRKGTFTISMVGTTTVDGQKCRWIEVKEVTRFRIAGEDVERTGITKILIPEKEIGKGKSPGEHMIRGWVRGADSGDVRALKDKEAPELLLFRTLWLAGPAPESREVEKADVETKPLGMLKCVGVTGTYELVQEGGNGYFTYENRLNDKAPFGLVSSKWKIERKLNAALVDEGTVTFTLIDINTTALSELLDKN
jgi:hypothetical protein